MTREELYKSVNKDNYIIDGNYIYFQGTNRIGFNLEIDVLCRVEIKRKKQYILNKSSNSFTDSETIFNDYIERKKNGVRGYKTITIGYIDNYCYISMIEFETIGSDGKPYWWIDRENKVKSDMLNTIKTYVKGLSSEFIKVS